MSETNLPILKFSWNTPVRVTFKYDPATAFKREGEYNGTPTVSYTHKLEANGKDMIFFATEKQHKAIIAANCISGKEYVLIKEEIPGSKSYNFLIRSPDVLPSSPTQSPTEPVSELETFLNAEDNPKDIETMRLCFKIAQGDRSLTLELYNRFQELANSK